MSQTEPHLVEPKTAVFRAAKELDLLDFMAELAKHTQAFSAVEIEVKECEGSDWTHLVGYSQSTKRVPLANCNQYTEIKSRELRYIYQGYPIKHMHDGYGFFTVSQPYKSEKLDGLTPGTGYSQHENPSEEEALV